ncbi:MAG: hypothetical protein WC453_01240 [Patescibacteria group bacterium]
MNFDNLIKNWHAKASEEEYFSKFIFEYLAFIALLKRKIYIDQNEDWKALRKLKNDEYVKSLYIEKVKDGILNSSWTKIKNELDKLPIGEVDQNSDIVHGLKYWDYSNINERGKIRNLDDWKNMIEFWHVIRNNLFHGSKNPNDKRDNLLIKNGYITLNALVVILMDENKLG